MSVGKFWLDISPLIWEALVYFVDFMSEPLPDFLISIFSVMYGVMYSVLSVFSGNGDTGSFAEYYSHFFNLMSDVPQSIFWMCFALFFGVILHLTGWIVVLMPWSKSGAKLLNKIL